MGELIGLSLCGTGLPSRGCMANTNCARMSQTTQTCSTSDWKDLHPVDMCEDLNLFACSTSKPCGECLGVASKVSDPLPLRSSRLHTARHVSHSSTRNRLPRHVLRHRTRGRNSGGARRAEGRVGAVHRGVGAAVLGGVPTARRWRSYQPSKRAQACGGAGGRPWLPLAP